MEPNQRDYFLEDNWEENVLPGAFGIKKGVLYVGHNVDVDWHKTKLLLLWKNWFNEVIRGLL